jgi:peptidoglycan/LPS O-acetylase OafA/YrhL
MKNEINIISYNPSLDGYRALAFIFIFLFHTISEFKGGYYSLQAFFVLSGYLITPNLIAIKNKNSSFMGYYKSFIFKRILRIFPIYFLYLIVITILILVFNLERIEYFSSLFHQLKYGYLFIYNYYHTLTIFVQNMYITHFWSLSVEEQFYLLWPFFIYLIDLKYLKKYLIVIIVISPFIRLLYAYFIGIHSIESFTINKELAVYLATFSQFDAFAIGALIACYDFGKLSSKKIALIFCSIVLIGMMIEFFSTGKVYFWNFGYAPFMNGAYKYSWGYTLVNIGFAFILIGLKHRSFLTQLFENKFLMRLGKISYGMYIYHYGIYATFCLLNEKYNMLNENYLLNRLFIAFICFILTYLVANISYNYIELRFLKLKHKIK